MTQLQRLLASSMASLFLAAGTAAHAQSAWSSAGRDLNNSRHQPSETRIAPATVGALQSLWAFDTAGDVTANPAIDGDDAYFPDSAGWLYKVRRSSGALVWKRKVSDYTGIAGDFARATPAIAGNLLILGNQSGKFLAAFGQGQPQPARVFAVNKTSGAPVWATQIDDTAMSFVTHSAIALDGTVYVGTASNEELVAGFIPKGGYPPYVPPWQWTFRGSMVALDVRTGAIKWKTYLVPEGYAGGAVWGSTGAIDPARKLLYVATGNNYAVPQSVLDCLNGGGAPAGCMSPDNHFDSIVALDLATGAIRWASRGLPYDAWNVGCGLNVPGFVVPPNDNCPNPKGPDWDFAQGPMLFKGARGRQLVGAGQKSGMFWAFDAGSGQLAWSTQVAPGGLTGGLQWGSASDGRRLYVAASNAGDTGAGQAPKPWTLKGGGVTVAGGWAALDPATGAVLWTTADPAGSRAEAAVSVANGVVFGCNLSAEGTLYALNAATGAPLWTAPTGGPCNAGPSISDGWVVIGSGTFNGFGPKKVRGFGMP